MRLARVWLTSLWWNKNHVSEPWGGSAPSLLCMQATRGVGCIFCVSLWEDWTGRFGYQLRESSCLQLTPVSGCLSVLRQVDCIVKILPAPRAGSQSQTPVAMTQNSRWPILMWHSTDQGLPSPLSSETYSLLKFLHNLICCILCDNIQVLLWNSGITCELCVWFYLLTNE